MLFNSVPLILCLTRPIHIEMKPTTIITAVALSFATVSVASPMPDDSFSLDPRVNVLEVRKGCSGVRRAEDKCSGKMIGPQESFHNWYVSSSRNMYCLHE